MNKTHKLYPLKGFEDYKISKWGEIYSTITKRYLKYDITKQGYCRIKLLDPRLGKIKNYSVHRLVALQFIPNPRKLPQVNHRDGNKKNNSVFNLEWCTSEYNIRHAVENRLYKIEEDSPTAKLTKEDVFKIHWLYTVRKFNKTEISKMYNISDATVGNILCGKRWSETYKELYDTYSVYKTKRRRFINSTTVTNIIKEYYLNNLSSLELEKKYSISNGYISKLVRGQHIEGIDKNIFKEIYERLGNQQPSLCNYRKVQRLKSACQYLKLNSDNDIV